MKKGIVIALLCFALSGAEAQERFSGEWDIYDTVIQTLAENMTYELMHVDHGFIERIEFKSPELAVLYIDTNLEGRIEYRNSFYAVDAGGKRILFTVQNFGEILLFFDRKGPADLNIAYTLSLEAEVESVLSISPFAAEKQTINFISRVRAK